MADTREQIYAFIEAQITDPLNRQNTALVVRNVLKYIVQNAANLADDDILALLNPFAPVTLTDAATIEVDGSLSVNFLLNNPGLVTELGFVNTQPGLDYRISVTNNSSEKTLALGTFSGVYKGYDGASTAVAEIVLPQGDCAILLHQESAGLRRIMVVDGANGETTTTEGEADASTTGQALAFTNPFGDVSDGVALTGNLTFTRTGNVLGSTVIRPITSTGSNTVTFDFAHYILNSDFVSGTALEAGDYELYFSNRGASVAVSIAEIGASGTAIPNSAPTANAGTDQSITLPTNSVTLSGSGSDSDGTVASYSWSKVSGGAATITDSSSASTTVTGLVAGSYVFRLTVTDNEGATSTDDITITVNAEAATPLNAPTGLTATASGQTQINLSWTDTNS